MASEHRQQLQLEQQLGAGVQVMHLPQVSSTSTRLKELIIAGRLSGPTVLVTNHQTAGRGTRSRSWFSAPPEAVSSGARARDLALTFAAPMPGELDPRFSLAIGALLADAVERCAHVPISVKWPNDLLAGDPPRKLGGVLLESTHGWMLVGVGVNVNSRAADFPPDIAPLLTTIAAERRKPCDVGMLQLAVVRALRQLPELDVAHWLAQFRQRDRTAGTQYSLNLKGKKLQVTAVAVEDNGELLLRDDSGGEHRISAFTDLERL